MSRLCRSTSPLRLTVALGIVAAAGCASNAPPMRYYTLSDVPPAQPPAEASGTGIVPPSVRLAPVSVPPELDRLQVVTHTDANQVEVHEFSRWAGPLDEQIRRTLSDDLAARVPVVHPDSMIVDPNAPAPKKAVRTLTVSLARLDVDSRCGVSVRAAWTLQGGGVAGQSGSEQIDQPAAAAECPAAAAVSVSQALAVLADRLAPSVMAPATPLP